MESPKKILIDLGKLKSRYTGLGEMSYNLGKNLAAHIDLLEKENIELTFLVPKEYTGEFGNRVKYVSLNSFRRHLPALFDKYDLWYSTHQDSAYRPGNSDCKILLTIHDLNVSYHNNPEKAEKRLAIIQGRMDRANVVTVNSNFTRQEIMLKLDPGDKELKVIYCGCVDFSQSAATKPEGLHGNESYFLHISTITPKKNTKALVEMMKLMPDHKLVIAGSWNDPYAQEIIAEIKKENLTNIIQLSKVSVTEKAWLYMHCEALFFPSLLEGFGLPVIEAMYCGKPVFSSTSTSLPEIGGDKAFYWTSFNPLAMKEIVVQNMQKVKDDPEFAIRLKEYADQFNWTKNVLQYIELMISMLKQTGNK